MITQIIIRQHGKKLVSWSYNRAKSDTLTARMVQKAEKSVGEYGKAWGVQTGYYEVVLVRGGREVDSRDCIA